jgi:hypothetical protein
VQNAILSRIWEKIMPTPCSFKPYLALEFVELGIINC